MEKISASITPKNWDIALDWATFSAPREGAERFAFIDWSADFMERCFERLPQKRDAKVRDYEGHRVGDTYRVQRPSDGHMLVIASGQESNRLAEEVIAYGIETRPTRLDIAATAECECPNPAYPDGIRENIARVRSAQGKKQRQIMGLFDHKNGSTGVTIGSRTSEVYGRIYDYEAKHCGGAKFRVWRHEVEYKGGAARRLWASYRDHPEHQKVLQATVFHRFDQWHVPVPWLADSGRMSVVGTKAKTSVEKRLEHLDKSVAPFILSLMNEGKTAEVMAILERHGILDRFK